MAKKKTDWKRRRLQRVEVQNGPIFDKLIDYRLPNPPDGMEGASIPEHVREAIRIRSFARSAKQFNFTLNRYESDLYAILKPYGDDLHNAPREAVDAFNALHNLALLREGRETGDIDLLILASIHLGINLTKADVRPFEPAVERGQKNIKATSKGGRTKHGTEEKRKADEERWRREIEQIRRANPRISRTEACQQVADGADVGCRTIWNRVGKNLPK